MVSLTTFYKKVQVDFSTTRNTILKSFGTNKIGLCIFDMRKFHGNWDSHLLVGEFQKSNGISSIGVEPPNEQ